jgi:ribosomal-protein-alanine N-acetyltransferase
MTPSLFSRTQQAGQCWIRPATNDDWLVIERLLHYADHHYLALEWWTIQEWLGSPALLLSTDRHDRPLGLMLAVTGNGPVAWLRAIAVVADECLEPLLAASAQAVLSQGGTGLAFLGDEAWILSELKRGGFQQANRVVTLRCRGDWSVCYGPPDLQVRAATTADIDDILVIDHAAFAPMWWYSREILHRALNSAFCFDVAYLGDVCAGYQFSTLRMGRGHIVRLATCPELRRLGIGARLLSEAMTTLDLAGVERITVNTQEDNWPSLQLYRRFNFAQVGELWAVWFRSLEQR